MSFSDNKITAEMLNGKGVVGMPNTPDLPASEMQRKFDELALEVIVPAYNELCDALEESSAEQGETISGIDERVTANTVNIEELESSKQDILIAGENITIDENNVISSTGGGDDIKDELWKRDRPYFVFIDDDGRNEFKNIYTNILKPRNIKAGLSICFSDYLLGSTGYLSVDELKEYEAQGNDILCHSTSIDTLVPDTADAVLRYCISQLKKYEFSNNGIFVYPNGNIGEDRIAIEEITSNYFNYGININYEHNCPAKIPIDNKFNIGRIFINSANLNTDAVKQYISEIIDDTFENNKLLIISTHSNKCDTEYLAEVLDTIINRGGIFESPVTVFKDLERTYVETQLSNRNLLDNPFFNVNSRNIPLFQHYEFHRNDSAYLLDRWRCRGGDMMVTDAGLSVSAIGNYSDDHIAGMIAQYFEKDLPSGTYTFTIKADGIVHTITFEHDSSRETELIVGKKFTLLIGELYLTMGDVFVDDIQPVPALEIIYNVNSPTVINAVKLEKGSVSTFENDVAPDINKEAHKCMLSKADADDDYANKEFADKTELNSKADVSALDAKADKTQLSNRNLLDNPFFNVNSRNIPLFQHYEFHRNDSAYLLDRWRCRGGDMMVTDAGLSVSAIGNYSDDHIAGMIAQYFEKDLPSGTYTFTIKADGIVHTITFEHDSSRETELIVGKKFTLLIGELYLTMGDVFVDDIQPVPALEIIYNVNSPTVINAVKLEKGSVSTFENDVAPDINKEAHKCMLSKADADDDYANKEFADKTELNSKADVSALDAKADKTQLSNRNLLDNPFFNVNSRNIPLFQHYEFHRNDSAYLLDRWRCRGGDMMVTDAGLSVSAIGNYSDDHIAGMIAQYFEKDLPSGTYTFTIKADGIVHTITFEHDSSRETELIVGKKFTLLIGELYLTMGDVFVDDIQPVPALEIIYNVNSPTVINAVKLEKGSVSTFENDVAPDINKEAHKCMLSKADADDDYANKEFADKTELNSKADVSALDAKADKTQLSNRNLLDNPFFNVNSRNIPLFQHYEFHRNDSAYLLDRWRCRGGDMMVTDAGLSVSAIGNYSDDHIAGMIAQYFEKDLPSGTYTFTIKADGIVHTITFEHDSSRETELIVGKKFTLLIGELYLTMGDVFVDDIQPVPALEIIYNVNSPTVINAVKLEKGSVSTFENDVAPDINKEAHKCMLSKADADDDYANKEFADKTELNSKADVSALDAKADKTQLSNRNLLDNPWFTVNQRGQSSYGGYMVYSADRWRTMGGAIGGNFIVDNNGLTFKYVENEYNVIDQVLSTPLSSGDVVTISVKIGSEIHSRTITVGEGGDYKQIGTSPIWVNVDQLPSVLRIYDMQRQANTTVRAVKLELGSISTLANDVAPNYAEELLKCQRYFIRYKANTSNHAFCIGHPIETSVLRFTIALPCFMAKNNPTVVGSGTLKATLSDSASSFNVSNLHLVDMCANQIVLGVYGTFEIGKNYMMILGDANTYIDISADL